MENEAMGELPLGISTPAPPPHSSQIISFATEGICVLPVLVLDFDPVFQQIHSRPLRHVCLGRKRAQGGVGHLVLAGDQNIFLKSTAGSEAGQSAL